MTPIYIESDQKEFGQPSRKFYRAFQIGKTGDDEEVMECAGEWETYRDQQLQQKIRELNLKGWEEER